MDTVGRNKGVQKGPDKVDIEPFVYAISLIDRKWKMEVVRYIEIKKALGHVTHKMSSTQLKELGSDGLLIRTEYPQVPPKVEYRLSQIGQSLIPVLHEICEWGQKHISR